MSKNKIIHAKRNKDLSGKLFKEAEYLDWSITTAFYSSIHFIESKYLPCTIQDKYCTNLSDIKRMFKCESKHTARLFLVQEVCKPLFYASYKNLFDKCLYARYTSYKTTPSEAEKIQKDLSYISKNCENCEEQTETPTV